MAYPTSSPDPSPMASRRRTSSKTDKRALLDALAAQLKHEKAQAEHWAQKMICVEEAVQAKHREFLEEEERLSRQRDANTATIASLRRELARARRSLEEALHVEADEAQGYLALLSSAAGATHIAQDVMVTASEGSDLDGELHRGDGDEDSRRHTSAIRTSEGVSSENRPPTSGDIVPPSPERPTSRIVGHPFQHEQPHYDSVYPSHALPPGARSHGAVLTSSELGLDRSVWHDDSLLDERHEAPVGMHPELARNGGRWSRVFPGLTRRMSASQPKV